MKKCPFCFEEIQEEAIFCKHCKNDLTTQSAKKAFAKVNEKSSQQKMQTKNQEYNLKKNDDEAEEFNEVLFEEKQRNKWINSFWWLMIIIGLIFLTINIYISLFIFIIAINLAIWLKSEKSYEENEKNKANKVVCKTCGFIGNPEKIKKGHFYIELALWLFFLIPGLIYSIWRSTSQYDICPKCKHSSIIPENSPIGQKLIKNK